MYLQQISVVSDSNCLNRLLGVSATRVQELTQDMREDVSCCSNMHLTAGQHAKGSDMCKAARPFSPHKQSKPYWHLSGIA